MKKSLYLGLNSSQFVSNKQIIHCPIIQIVPTPPYDPPVKESFGLLPQFTHIIFTSKSAVKIFCEYLVYFGIPVENLNNKILIAVGKVTASHLLQHGLIANIVAQEETAEGVLKALHPLDIGHAYFFWPHSAQSRSIIPDYFMEHHIPLKDCILYSTELLIPEILPDFEEFDEIIFTSPSTVDAFKSIFGTLPKDKRLVAIGPITEAYLSC